MTDKTDRLAGEAKEKVGQAKDKVEEGIDKVKDAIHRTVNRARNSEAR